MNFHSFFVSYRERWLHKHYEQIRKGSFSFYEIVFKVSKPKSKNYPTELLTVGHHIRKKRLDMNLSLSQLSQILGEDKVKISKWENGNTVPIIYSFSKIIEFLGYDPLFDKSGTLQAKIENYKRKYGFTYKHLTKFIPLGYTTLLQFAKQNKGSKRTVGIIKQFFEELSD